MDACLVLTYKYSMHYLPSHIRDIRAQLCSENSVVGGPLDLTSACQEQMQKCDKDTLFSLHLKASVSQTPNFLREKCIELHMMHGNIPVKNRKWVQALETSLPRAAPVRRHVVISRQDDLEMHTRSAAIHRPCRHSYAASWLWMQGGGVPTVPRTQDGLGKDHLLKLCCDASTCRLRL
eukprot:1721371-Amphidinium_carterae.1